jgi:hypothetical protein
VLALSRVRRDHSSKNRRATLTQTDRCASPCSASTSNRRPCPLFTSSGQVNSWLSFKRLSQALPGKAGGAAVTTMVDHTSMRGSRPHDLCASRSCLGLSTSIGSAIRHIVDARVPPDHDAAGAALAASGDWEPDEPKPRIRGFGVRRVLRDARNLSAERANLGAYWKVSKFSAVGLRPVFFLRWCDADHSEPKHFSLA